MQVFFIKRLKVEKKMLNQYLLNVVSSTNPSKFSCCKYCAKFAIVSCSLLSLTLKPASFRALKKEIQSMRHFKSMFFFNLHNLKCISACDLCYFFLDKGFEEN